MLLIILPMDNIIQFPAGSNPETIDEMQMAYIDYQMLMLDRDMARLSHKRKVAVDVILGFIFGFITGILFLFVMM